MHGYFCAHMDVSMRVHGVSRPISLCDLSYLYVLSKEGLCDRACVLCVLACLVSVCISITAWVCVCVCECVCIGKACLVYTRVWMHMRLCVFLSWCGFVGGHLKITLLAGQGWCGQA